MGGENGVIGLDNRRGDLRRWIDDKFEFALLPVIDRETLHEQRAESRSSATAKGVEYEETLQTGAVVCDPPDLIQNLIDELLADRVVATRVVVGGIFFASDHLVWMEEVAVLSSSHFVDNVGLEVTVDGSGDVFALTCTVMLPSIPKSAEGSPTAYQSQRRMC